MKLNKIDETPKKANKKAIIITASTVAVLTLSGVAGWMFIKEGENNVTRFAQNIVAGQNVKKSLGDSDFVLDPPAVRSLQSLLSKTGFGFSVSAYDYKYNKTTQDMVDKHSESSTPGEKLYLLCNQDEVYDYKTYKGVDFLTYMKNFLFGDRCNHRRRV